ncbi:glyoxalase [Halothiobacillus diazotrophicus]|uniref:Glyoxalase n=1 Tax=Halothiobacillus diazotrophicus TaxID=1860122 RepID=A0A191ZJM7_9GAMM|nr:VOC family protein [Halothiobacillus diazotrophicus]ANJ68070.1 glyoxalase [Halothiobacillus diazotrophicus]
MTNARIEVIGIDHIYLTVSDLRRAESFYDLVLLRTLGFRKSRFALGGDPHIQYYNRHFGYVLRPSHRAGTHDADTPGLHHFCFRVATVEAVQAVSTQLRTLGIDASEAQRYEEYAPDYWATFFSDPDGLRLEVTNYRQERQHRHDNWLMEE